MNWNSIHQLPTNGNGFTAQTTFTNGIIDTIKQVFGWKSNLEIKRSVLQFGLLQTAPSTNLIQFNENNTTQHNIHKI